MKPIRALGWSVMPQWHPTHDPRRGQVGKKDILRTSHWQVCKMLPLKQEGGGFPGGPAAKTLCSECRGASFDSWSGK